MKSKLILPSFIFKLFFAFLLISTSVFSTVSKAFAADDLAGWAYLEWTMKKYDNYWIDISHEDRWYDNLDYYSYSENRVRLNVKLLSWLNGSVAESLLYLPKDNTTDRHESRPQVELRPFWKGEYYGLDYRQRLEMKEVFGDSEGTTWVTRNRFQVAGSKDYFGAVQPVLSNEIFYNLSDGEWDQNRVFGGMRFEVIKGVIVNPSVGYQAQKNDDGWYGSPVIAINVTMDLPA